MILRSLISIFVATVGLLPTSFGQAPPIRIIPMGDSITDGTALGTAGGGGYRGPLYNLLTTAGYNVDYVGSLNNNGALLVDKDHEGHGGWRIDQLDANVAGWFNTQADPDVILLHIGTNDFGQNVNTTTAIDRLDALITKMATLRPFAHIIVTNLMERNGTANTNIVDQFNPFVEARVNAQAALGRRVTFLDMRSAVPIADMPDNLHPNQTGYDKMAAAWLPAIQAVIGVNGDNSPPALVRARAASDRTHVDITFSKPVADSAADIANFSLNGGLTISAAQLDATKRIVTLTTSQQVMGTEYTATVNGVVDRTAGPLPIAANSIVVFSAATPRGYLNNVPESDCYTLALSLDVPNAADWKTNPVPYLADYRSTIGPFQRVAYYVELQSGTGDLKYVWASMDAFTTDLNQIGVPTVVSGAQIQQAVSNLNVVSNVAGVLTGNGLSGNLEFWPTNYQSANSAGIAGASETLFDYGDRPTPGAYGSMQLHNAAADQTIFALNNWGGNASPGNLDLGIGNDPAPVTGGRDWTFHHNAADYTIKSLQVLVRTTGDTISPTLVSAAARFGRTQISVQFSESLAPASVTAQNFNLDQGVVVIGARLAASQREVILTTTIQPTAPLTLTVNGVRDTSPVANRIAAGSTIPVAIAALPSEVVTNVGALANGYELVYSMNIPVTGNLVANGADAYAINDRDGLGTFSRVAYYMELQRPGAASEFVWVSMDPFTQRRDRIGVPTAASGAIFQQNVTNLEVLSNVSGVVNGTSATGGNIEFWSTDYSAANATAVPGASATTYDFGDSRTATGGYGSMQVHNHDALQTVFAFNRFGVDGNRLDVGIGNAATGNPDYTFAANSNQFSRRVLHVMVLPGTLPAVTPLIANVPDAQKYQLVYSLNIPAVGNLHSGNGFVPYSTDLRNDVGTFSRVAYYLELQKSTDTSVNYVWASMDAFTNNIGRVGVPNVASGAFFQQRVTNLNVVSNVSGVTNGTNLTTGNIEFFPSNYNATNAISIPGASATAFDFGDGGAGTAAGHGSMQVHNHGASQTLFAMNNWGAAGNTTNQLALGIGNNPTAGSAGVGGTQQPDWTFTGNAGTYDVRRVLQVYVLPGPSQDTAAPTLVRAVGSTTLNRLTVTFNEPVADISAVAGNFAIAGLTVTGASLHAGQRDIFLTTTTQTPGTIYTVVVNGIRDRSSAANPIAANASTTFVGYQVPALLTTIPEAAGYTQAYQLALPSTVPQWNNVVIPYSVDEGKYFQSQSIDRVAYCLELDGNWAFASFNAHTPLISKVGVPTLGVTATPMQQLVTDMTVASNVNGVVTGTGLTGGNIEFWGGNYSAPNANAIPNASAINFDFGDTMTAGGHGSLQIHNHGSSQTVLAYNNWGSNTTGISDIGIGNSPAPVTNGVDWTFSANAATYTTRRLYVLTRTSAAPSGAAPALLAHPCDQVVNQGDDTSFLVRTIGTGPFSYQWRRNGQPIPSATEPWLDILEASLASEGDYDVVVTGTGGASTVSLVGTLTLNESPVFAGYAATTTSNTPLNIAKALLLVNGVDPEADSFDVSSVATASAQGGTVAFANGIITYTPLANYVGADSFTFVLTDARGAQTVGTVDVTVSAAGPQAPDSIALTAGGDVDLVFARIAGQQYIIQRSTDLLDWSNMETITAAPGGVIEWTDEAPPVGRAYYRTKKVIP